MGKWKQPPGVDMTTYGKVPLNQLWAGRVVYAHIPYRDKPQVSKTRPCVVVWKEGGKIYVCPMYSRSGPHRVETVRHNRRCYVDLHAVLIERYNLVNLDPEDISDEVWDQLLDRVIFPEDENETGNELLNGGSTEHSA